MIIWHIKGLLLYLVMNAGPKMHDLGFEGPSSCPIALRDFKAHELKVFPYGREISERRPQRGSSVIVKAAVSGTPSQQFYIAAPGLATLGEAKDEGQMHWVSPFWNAVAARGDMHELQITYHSFNVSLQTTSKPQGKPGEDNNYNVPQSKPPKLVITVPYLINTVQVQRMTGLKAAKSKAVLG